MVNIEMVYNTLIHTGNRIITTVRNVDLKVAIATEIMPEKKLKHYMAY